MFDEIRENFLRYYLGRFAVDQIDKNIWNLAESIDPEDNLIILARPDVDLIKQTMCSLLMKDRKYLDYKECDLREVADRTYSETPGGDDFDYDNTFIRPKILVILEFNDVRNKTYNELITSLVGRRMMDEKSTILILTCRTPEEFFVPELIGFFQRLDVRNVRNRLGSFGGSSPPRKPEVKQENKIGFENIY